MKITPVIANKISEMYATGKTVPEIQKYILETYKVKISPQGIYKHIRIARKQRAEIAKKVVQDYMQDSLPSDLELLKNILEDLKQKYNDEDISLNNKIKIANQINTIVNTRLKYSGAGTDDKEIAIKFVSDDDEDDE